MKILLFFTMLIFSSLALGESLSLKKAIEDLNRGDTDKVQSYLKLEKERQNTVCMEGVLKRINRGQWEFDSCLTERQKVLLLILALRRGESSVALSLIESGVDLNSQDKNGNSPLHWASSFRRYEYIDIVLALIKKGADLNIQNRHGSTPLHLSCRHGQKDIALTLIEKGADLNSQDEDGNSPLHLASGYNSWYSRYKQTTDIALTLIIAGADLNIQNNFGNTPLHRASRYGNKNIALALIENGADIEIENSLGYTAFDLARIKSTVVARVLAENTKSSLKKYWRLWKIED